MKARITDLNMRPGRHEIVRQQAGSLYPLKIVVSTEGDTTIVITLYPLKKAR